MGLQCGLCGGPDTPRRLIQDSEEADRVVRVVEKAEVGKQVLHLGPLVEPHGSDDGVGNAQKEEPLFKRTGLGVRAEEDADAPVRDIELCCEPLNLPGDRRCLFVRGHGLLVDDAVPHLVPGPETFFPSIRIAPRDRVGGTQDGLCGAVVFFEGDHACARKVLLEGEKVVYIRTAPAIDRLVVVPHDAEFAPLRCDLLQQKMLCPVCVLVFVHQDGVEFLPVARPHIRARLEQAQGEDDQVAEIERIRFLHATLVVCDGFLDDSSREGLLRNEEGRVDPLVLRLVQQVLDRHGADLLRVHPLLLQRGLDHPQLVGCVVDDEVLAIAESLDMLPQDPGTGRVKRADPDP